MRAARRPVPTRQLHPRRRTREPYPSRDPQRTGQPLQPIAKRPIAHYLQRRGGVLRSQPRERSQRRDRVLDRKEALAVKRAQGVRLGRRSTLPDATAARIVAERAAGRTLQAIADGLSADGVETGQGGQRWYASSVRAVLGSVEHRPR